MSAFFLKFIPLVLLFFFLTGSHGDDYSGLGGFTIGDGPQSAKLVYHKTWDSRREPRIQSKNAELREMALRILYDMDEGKLYFARESDKDIFLVTSSQHQNRIHRIRVVRKLASFQAGKDLILGRARSALEEKDRVQIDKVEKESSLKLVLRSPMEFPFSHHPDGYPGDDPFPHGREEPHEGEFEGSHPRPPGFHSPPNRGMPPHHGGHPGVSPGFHGGKPHGSGAEPYRGSMEDHGDDMSEPMPPGGTVGSPIGGPFHGRGVSSPIGHPPNDGDVYNPIGIPVDPHPMDHERTDCLQQIKKGGFSFCVVEKQYLLEDYAGDGSYRLIIELKSEGDYSSDE